METPLTLDDILYKPASIEDYQTTFVILKTDKKNIRIDFDSKVEFRLRKHHKGEVLFFTEHPLLINYNEQLAGTYINSKPDNVDELIIEIKSVIDSITLGWREWTSFLSDKMNHNIENGYGKLLEAPKSITEKVVYVCNNHKAETKTFYHKEPSFQCKMIMIENNYVIAKDFKISKPD